MARLLESLFIDGPVGRLEALHEGPDDDIEIVRAVVVCHPHPVYGGTLHNKVTFRLARAARRAQAAVLRFNFRSAGQSQGVHDHGHGEQDDVRAAVAFMQDAYPDLPLALAGFSFGAAMALKVACKEPDDFEFVIAAGAAVNKATFGFLNDCPVDKRFIHSTNDEHGRRDRMEEVFESAAKPKRITWIEAKDHFFVDKLDEFENAALEAFSS